MNIDAVYEKVAAALPDELLARELDLARRDVLSAVRTRKEIARHRVGA